MSFNVFQGSHTSNLVSFNDIHSVTCRDIIACSYCKPSSLYNVHIVVFQYPLYTIMVFDEWRNGIPVAFFVKSRTREQDLHPVLQALQIRIHTLKRDWAPSSIIVDNAQAKFNTLRYSWSCLTFFDIQCPIYVFHAQLHQPCVLNYRCSCTTSYGQRPKNLSVYGMSASLGLRTQ